MGLVSDLVNRTAYHIGQDKRFFDILWKRQVKLVDPFQDWNSRYGAVFIHVPKAAGQSIKKSLGILDHPKMGHCPAIGFKFANERRYNSMHSFAVVRHPVSRLISAFTYLTEKTPYTHDQAWAQKNLSGFDQIEDFINRLSNTHVRARVLPWMHFRPQSHYLTDPDGTLIVDKIIKLEEIDDSFKQLCLDIGVKADLTHTNISQPRNSAKFELTKSMKDSLSSIYGQDLDLLEYQL